MDRSLILDKTLILKALALDVLSVFAVYTM